MRKVCELGARVNDANVPIEEEGFNDEAGKVEHEVVVGEGGEEQGALDEAKCEEVRASVQEVTGCGCADAAGRHKDERRGYTPQ